MKRSPWPAVLATVVVLASGTAAATVPLSALRAASTRFAAAIASIDLGASADGARQSIESLAESEWAARLAAALSAPETLRAGAAALIAGAIAAAVVARRRPRWSRRRVLSLARRGQPPARIARRTGLAQDVVRHLLRPNERALAAGPAGSLFRPATSAPPDSGTGRGRAGGSTR